MQNGAGMRWWCKGRTLMADESIARRAAAVAASTAAFRAAVEERLRNLEANVAEVKSRLNGLLFLVAGAVLTQIVLHLLRW